MKCYRPFVYGDLYLPCGKCDACLANKKINKLARISRCNMRGVFFTLTYDNDSVPFVTGRSKLVFRKSGVVITPDLFAGKRDNLEMDMPSTPQMVLLKYDITNFIKRLRKKLHEEFPETCSLPLGYFICGEYSPVPKSRPHFHGLLFCDCAALFDKKTASFRWLRWDYPRFAEYISACWPYCSEHRLTRYTSEIISGAAADYCSKYISKSYGDRHLFAPFAKTSQRLGSTDTFVRRFLLMFFQNFGRYSKFCLDPVSTAFCTPSNLSRFLCKPYRLLRGGVDATYSRVACLVGKKSKEVEHSADFSFLRCYRNFKSITGLQIDLYYFLILIYNYYYEKAQKSLAMQYLEYDPINYDITWDFIYNCKPSRAQYYLLKFTHRIGISVEDYLGFEQKYYDKFSVLLTQSQHFKNKKLYTFEK